MNPANAARIDALLPQTQCTRCGYRDCRAYAEAIANDGAPIDRCPPGGDATIAALARLTGHPVVPLDPAFGAHAGLVVARIDEAACIGCTLCIAACPVDAILGAPKRMHDVAPSLCSGCELCVPACPVDCIALVPAERGWITEDAAAARIRHEARRARLARGTPSCRGHRRGPRATRGERRSSSGARPCTSRWTCMNAAKRRAIFERLRAANPHPTTELDYATPFELLVAVVLSAQATDRSVNLATRKLYPVARTPQGMVKLGVDGLAPYISSIGLWRGKAKNVVALSQLLIERHGGEVPADRDALQALPGVGRKTANVVLNTAFGQPTIAVDTHIFRVANRTGLAPGRNVEEVEQRLEKFVPDEFRQDCHHWLILHGRYVCTARAPKCATCVIVDLCEYRHKNLPAPVA